MSQQSDLRREPLIDSLRKELDGLDHDDLLWRIRTLQSPSAPHAKVDGKNVLVLCSNNYLGLANHPRLKQAAIAATRKYGAGSGSVRVIAGTMDIHIKLEKVLADYRRAESAITFQSGYATNAGTILALVDERDLIISDELNHGSIIDGCRMTKAERRVYKHKDMGDLEKQLQNTDRFRRVLIITDGVFSMDGDIAPLKDIVDLAAKYQAITYVDDAHGDGVLGGNHEPLPPRRKSRCLHGDILQSIRMCRWLRCWIEILVHLSPEQGPKLSSLRVSTAWCPGSLHRRDPTSEEEPVAGEEALGQYPILQESIEGLGLRYRTERDPHHSSHGW